MFCKERSFPIIISLNFLQLGRMTFKRIDVNYFIMAWNQSINYLSRDGMKLSVYGNRVIEE